MRLPEENLFLCVGAEALLGIVLLVVFDSGKTGTPVNMTLPP